MEHLLHAGCCHKHFVYLISLHLHFCEVEGDTMPRPTEVQIPKAGKLQSWNLSLGGLSAGPPFFTLLGCLCSPLFAIRGRCGTGTSWRPGAATGRKQSAAHVGITLPWSYIWAQTYFTLLSWIIHTQELKAPVHPVNSCSNVKTWPHHVLHEISLPWRTPPWFRCFLLCIPTASCTYFWFSIYHNLLKFILNNCHASHSTMLIAIDVNSQQMWIKIINPAKFILTTCNSAEKLERATVFILKDNWIQLRTNNTSSHSTSLHISSTMQDMKADAFSPFKTVRVSTGLERTQPEREQKMGGKETVRTAVSYQLSYLTHNVATLGL